MMTRPIIAIGAVAVLAIAPLDLAVATPQERTGQRPGTQADVEQPQPQKPAPMRSPLT